MKDLYSVARTKQVHDELYETIKQAYVKVYDRLGIGDKTFLTFASGGMFSKYSHEFQTVCEAGEDTIYLDRQKGIAVNEEVNNPEVLENLDLKADDLEEVRAAEVGNIFTLKDKFSKPLELNFTDEEGKTQPVLMGCYGIGPSRLVGVMTELLADDKGLVWPAGIAPYDVYLVSLGADDEVVKAADELYDSLKKQNIKVLYDDRDERAGEKFADADLLGIPHRVVISKKTLEQSKLEYKARIGQDIQLISSEELHSLLDIK